MEFCSQQSQSQRVHVRQQVLYLLLIQCLAEGRHLAAPGADDFPYAVVVRGQTTLGKVLFLEDAFQTRALLPAGRIRLVALIAVAIVNTPACALLGIQPQFRIRLSDLGIAALEEEKRCESAKENPERPATTPILQCLHRPSQ
jgi:hypothetical protein